MRILFYSIFLSIGLLANSTTYEVGVLINTFFKDTDLSKMILKSVEKKVNGLNEINVVLTPYIKEEEILNDLKSNKIRFAVVNPEVLFRNEKDISSHIKNQKWTLFISQNKQEEYYLIKHKDSKANFSNISDYQINFRDGVPSSKYWLETEIYKKHKKSYKNIVKNENFIKKRNKLALNPYFNKEQISVIEKSDFELMGELNPQLKNSLTIIKKSQPIFYSLIGLTQKSVLTQEYMELYDILHNMDNLLEGDEFTSIIPCVTNLYILKDEDVEILRNFYLDYFSLKKEYR